MTPLRIGLVFELLGSRPPGARAPDADAEYEPEETLALLERALAAAGHEPVRLGGPHELLARLGKGEGLGVDAALNIAEGHGSRNREAWAPVLLEMAGVPTLGSDALTLSLSLDKAWTLERVGGAGVRVAGHVSIGPGESPDSVTLPGPYPLFVKPRWEGTAKGILPSSRVEDAGQLADAVARIHGLYDQPALVEPFLAGAEYTVTVVGHRPPRALPVLQRALETTSRIGLHALDRATVTPPPGGFEHVTPGELGAELERELRETALQVFRLLRCRDFARLDFRLGEDGLPRFLEINPLPTLAPGGSFGILAELEGRPVEALLADVFAEGLVRLGLAPGAARSGGACNRP